MRSRVRFLVLTWGFFLEGEDSCGDHGLGSLVELKFKVPPDTSYSYTVEPRFTNLIRSGRPFVTRNVRKPKLFWSHGVLFNNT
jgi:hypothetical protein